MASEWYYAHEGQTVGPVSLEELRRLADSGELQRTDLVWTAPMKEWEEAGGFDELFAPAVDVAPPVEPDPPAEPVAPGAPSRTPVQPGRSSGAPRTQNQYQGRGQGGQAGRGAGAGYYDARRSQGVPPIVLIGFIITIAGIAICAPISIIGAICCMIGLGEAKRRQEGVGLAVAGIVIGLIFFVLGIIGVIFFIAMESGGLDF